MHKLNSSGTYSDTLPRDAELQLRLADGGGAGDGKENGAGKQFLARPEEENSFCTKRKMLVGLDVICLCIASIPFFACELKTVTPYQRGFFCGDSTITYPYVEREAIPDSLLIAGGIVITGLTFYLQARLSWRGARLLRPLIQFLLVMIAIYTGLTRISDYRHHPSDVLTGFIQGGLTAYWVAFYISSMFKPCTRPDLSPTSMSLESPLSSQQTVC
ncbi:unnamed protein product [Tetraodon nigroviridis]|uniref:(spotted green pufferfish) hypothetical protein n=1 Tax=Tetraodon nigroviridis TaxID=99883 RepID=Q4SW03_TETNG|nr:unnamed protein product [Tetraodon nigroviridis]